MVCAKEHMHTAIFRRQRDLSQYGDARGFEQEKGAIDLATPRGNAYTMSTLAGVREHLQVR